MAAAVDAGQLQGQGGGGVLFGAGGGGGKFGGEEVEMEGVRPGAAVVVVGEFLQGLIAPRQAAVFDCLAAVKLAGVDAGRAFDVADEGVASAMNAGQKPWLSRCWLRVSGERRMKFWWRLAKFIGGSLGWFASGGRVVRGWVRRLRKSRFSRLSVCDVCGCLWGKRPSERCKIRFQTASFLRSTCLRSPPSRIATERVCHDAGCCRAAGFSGRSNRLRASPPRILPAW